MSTETNTAPRSLQIVMYHYVRDLPNSRFPRIKGMLLDDFRRQVDALAGRFEMATLESALAFVDGRYQPKRDLCLLTFDDGLREHYEQVTPFLAERRIQGIFFAITACLEEGRVISAHKNHFLMAGLDFEVYQRAFLAVLAEMAPDLDTQVDAETAARSYRWDTPEVAAFKVLLNYRLPEALKDSILDQLFTRYLGDEAAFARELYLSWDEARQMQAAGMVIGGHTHTHAALGTLNDAQQLQELETSARILFERIRPQTQTPFSYPYGKPGSYNEFTITQLRRQNFCCAFTSEVGPNLPEQDVFRLRRLDPKDVSV